MTTRGADSTFVDDASLNTSCVDAAQALRPILGSAASIDLINIDIEGFESEVLNCFPFHAFNVTAVLMETNKVKTQNAVRELDLFFHRHGFVNDQTFLNMNDRSGHISWLDNLFVRRRSTILPPTKLYKCSQLARKRRSSWCGPWAELPRKAYTTGFDGGCAE